MTVAAARPLAGRRVLVTRARAQAKALAALLAEQGAEPVVLPLIEPAPVAETQELDRCIARLARGLYHWLIFSSANGGRFFRQRLHALGYGADICQQARVVAGPATAQSLAEQGIQAAVVPGSFSAETVLASLAGEPLAGQRILLPRAAGGRELLPASLRRRGVTVDEVVLYRSVPVPESAAALADWLCRGALDAVTFTSGSTVRHFVAAITPASSNSRHSTSRRQGDTLIACLGLATAATARDLGLRVDAVAAETTMRALVDALAAAFDRRGPGGMGKPCKPVKLRLVER